MINFIAFFIDCIALIGATFYFIKMKKFIKDT